MVRLAREFEANECGRAKLTLGAPGIPLERFIRWLGVRLIAWPDDRSDNSDSGGGRGAGDCGGGSDEKNSVSDELLAEFISQRRLGVASSRIGRALDQRPDWFAALRTACAEACDRQWLLLDVPGTTTGPFLFDAARRSGARRLRIEVAEDDAEFGAWLSAVIRTQVGPTTPSNAQSPRAASLGHEAALSYGGVGARRAEVLRLRVSPPLKTVEQWRQAMRRLGEAELDCAGLELAMVESAGDDDGRLVEASASLAKLPARDRVLCLFADELRVLELRRQGNWAQLLAARQAESLGGACEVRLNRKAGKAGTGKSPLIARTTVIDPTPPPSASLESLEGLALLAHCTRRQDGPWPGQAWSDYFDELWDDRPAKDRSACAALENILRTGRLFASSSAIRGGTPVVCFTARPPRDLAALRRFQNHRHRWDFEPYGLAISQEWLSSQGARPVHYGPASLAKQLSPSDLPFFQPSTSRSSIDWTVESEWRFIGDLHLEKIPTTAAFVLVPTESDAARLAPLSAWPVVVIRT